MNGRLSLLPVIALMLAACAGGAGTVQPASVEPSTTSVAPASPSERPTASASERAATFSTAAFANVREDPVPDATAADFQGILYEAAQAGGMTATVMTANGIWSGAVGTADGTRDMRPDDQLNIGSITKPVVATQVMQLVEAGELALDDPASGYLPADLDFDTNEATIRHLLGMRSGIPDYVDALYSSLSADPKRTWTAAEVLELVSSSRSPVGRVEQYSSTNYVLLGLIIEKVRGRPVAEVLRRGVLSGNGLERLIFQPDEAPTEPMAMPGAEATALETGGGYLPSLAGVTAAGPAGGMASDAQSLARWWSRLCSGEIVSEASLIEMMAFPDGGTYGLGVSDESQYYGTLAVGHGGLHVGFSAVAACLVEDGTVVVVLTNQEDIERNLRVGSALAAAARSD